MKYLRIVLISFVTIFLAAGCMPGSDETMEVYGGSYQLNSNETLKGNLALVGASGVLEEGSIVEGEVLIVGGSVEIAGKVIGDISVIGGDVELADSAEIGGNISSLEGNIERSDEAIIGGGIIGAGPDEAEVEVSPAAPWMTIVPYSAFPFGLISEDDLDWALRVPIYIFLMLLWVGVGALMVLIFPKNVERVANTILDQPWACMGFGLLAIITGFAASLTLVLLPIICLLSPVFIAAWIFGKIGLGLAIGRKIEPSFNNSMSPVVTAGIGILLIELVVILLDLIPCVGWIGGFVIGLVGLGAVVLAFIDSRRQHAN